MRPIAISYRSPERIAWICSCILNGLLLLACYLITFHDRRSLPLSAPETSPEQPQQPARVSYYNTPLEAPSEQAAFDTQEESLPLLRPEGDPAVVLDDGGHSEEQAVIRSPEPLVTTPVITEAVSTHQEAAPTTPQSITAEPIPQHRVPPAQQPESTRTLPVQQETSSQEPTAPVTQRKLPPRGSAHNRWRKVPSSTTTANDHSLPAEADRRRRGPQAVRNATDLVEQVSNERRATRQAHAVYQRHDVRGRIAAQLQEIKDNRYKRQVAYALHTASVEHRVPFHALKAVDKEITLRIVLNHNGDVISVEFGTSTGYPELDAHIAQLIHTCGRLPIPPNATAQNGCYLVTLPTHVRCDATTQILGFLYPGGGGDSIL